MGQESSKQEKTVTTHTGVKLQEKSRIKYMLDQSFFPLKDDKVIEAADYYIGTFKDGMPCVVPTHLTNLIQL